MRRQQQGSVLIVTLWTITLLTILVTVIAAQNRLSARVAFYQQEDVGHWARVLAGLNQGEMELMLERMPRPPETIDDLDELNREPRFRYNGQELELAYPKPEGVTVRIYDHAGKINLRELSRAQLRLLLEKRLGESEDDRIEEMLAAWTDWHDLNDGESVNGAERDYYEALDPPYTPRNGRLETVSEILHIRGFAEVFGDVDLEAAFTLYGEGAQVNLNLATVEAMRLLPGLDEELIRAIVAFRERHDFRGNGDVALIVPAENMAELRIWIDNRKFSDYYTVMAYPENKGWVDEEGKPVEIDESYRDPEAAGLLEADLATNAFAETVQVNTSSDRPRVMKVDPYARIPERIVVRYEDYDFDFEQL